jgi:hypothetical protein
MRGGLTWTDVPGTWDDLGAGDLWDLGEFTQTDTFYLRTPEVRAPVEASSSLSDTLTLSLGESAGAAADVFSSDTLRLRAVFDSGAACAFSWPAEAALVGVWGKAGAAASAWTSAPATPSPWGKQAGLASAKESCNT